MGRGRVKHTQDGSIIDYVVSQLHRIRVVMNVTEKKIAGIQSIAYRIYKIGIYKGDNIHTIVVSPI